MNNRGVIIIGSGHLAYKVKKLLAARGYNTRHFPDVPARSSAHHTSTIDILEELFSDVDFPLQCMVYVLDENDEANLEILIALINIRPDTPITASLFNENLRPHLEKLHPTLRILNPARIAAPSFVQAIDELTADGKQRVLRSPRGQESKSGDDSLIKALIFSFGLLILLATFYFHFFEKHGWLDALYFVVVTVATVGYGDISLLNSSPVTKVIGILLMLSSTVFMWVIFSLIIDRMIKKRVQLSLGRKRYRIQGHIIICGLGRLGYFIAETLLKRGDRVIIIEARENAPHLDYLRSIGASIYIGNAREPSVLTDVAIGSAHGIISVINDDIANLEIGLSARTCNPSIRPILRVFDERISSLLKDKLHMHTLLSVSGIAVGTFADIPEMNNPDPLLH